MFCLPTENKEWKVKCALTSNICCKLYHFTSWGPQAAVNGQHDFSSSSSYEKHFTQRITTKILTTINIQKYAKQRWNELVICFVVIELKKKLELADRSLIIGEGCSACSTRYIVTVWQHGKPLQAQPPKEVEVGWSSVRWLAGGQPVEQTGCGDG